MGEDARVPAEGGGGVDGGDTGNVKFQPQQQHAARVLGRLYQKPEESDVLDAARKWVLKIRGQ